jgi:transcription-repair coupling factor (superfamily II helicase)
MPDKELEKVMLTFMRGEADILVSTTIIESGIDIATANTMFINDADRFGLADLHQLRGRVGRYKHRAYCYMLLPLDRPVGEVAVKRLKAIEEFSMLGAGFKIAMRDLEIRGAGNILGPEQSGHIAAVGYEMYCQLLETAVKELKHEPTHVASQTSIEIGITGMIPKRYIASDLRRMAAYRRIATAQSPAEIDQITTELRQAYGSDLPATTQRLLGLARLRAIASQLKVRSIAVRGQDVLLRARPDDASGTAQLLQDESAKSASSAGGTHVTVLPPKQGEDHAEIYFRPPAAWMEPATLMGVLTRRLGAPLAPVKG